jgi:hypothetical protein
MKNRLVVLALASAPVVACSRSGSVGDPSAQFDKFGSFNAAKVEISAEGGFAALAVNHIVRHDDRAFVYSQRHICNTACGAPLDSASGTLSPAAADSLFNIVLAQDPFGLKDDYGATRGGADMMSYTVRITVDGRVKTVHADDGTMPPAMRAIVRSVAEIVSAARR